MILRRFMKHVTDQNWFAVGLDVLVVITGIFLGMQVTDWNEDRKDQYDSRNFLNRIHAEILIAEKASSRVRSRRLDLIEPLTAAARIIFNPTPQEQLSDDQCLALATSHYFHISVPDLPSLAELMSAGRVSIIEDERIRTGLISLQQTFGALQVNIQNLAPLVHDLPVQHPELIISEPYYSEDLGEMQARYVCNLGAMLQSRSFLNKASENVDGYDVYLRDGLRPWSEQMNIVHRLLDQELEIIHEIEK
jgi:hypothetical protein